jgi:hypothetical protein
MAHGRGSLTRAVMLPTLPLPVAVLAPRYNFADEDNLPYPVIFRECICHNRRVTWNSIVDEILTDREDCRQSALVSFWERVGFSPAYLGPRVPNSVPGS